jgi:hypothetical protein
MFLVMSCRKSRGRVYQLVYWRLSYGCGYRRWPVRFAARRCDWSMFFVALLRRFEYCGAGWDVRFVLGEALRPKRSPKAYLVARFCVGGVFVDRAGRWSVLSRPVPDSCHHRQVRRTPARSGALLYYGQKDHVQVPV